MIRVALLIALLTCFGTGSAHGFIASNFSQSQNTCNSYTGLMRSYGFTNYWRFLETSGTSAGDAIGTDVLTSYGTPTLNVKGPLVTPSKAVTLDGSTQYLSSTNAYNNPTTFTLLAWFKTTTTSGGKIVGFGNSQTGNSGGYDRHIYMTNGGNIVFGVYNGSVVTLSTAFAYNDGNWHMVAATFGAGGMTLSVDGSTPLSDANTSAQNYSGYLRIGFDNMGGWTSQPSSSAFAGSIAEVGFANGVAITTAQVRTLYALGSKCSNYVAPPATLTISGSPQTIYNGLCSSAITVNANQTSASPMTVSLAASGVSFYSDSSCRTSITSTSISAGTVVSPSIYFVGGSAGSATITASTSGFGSGTQTETFTANPYIWTGAGGNTNWATGGNWSGGSAPGSSNVALFDSTCTSNCSPTIAANMSVGGIRLASTYAGTITQAAAVTVTIGLTGYVQIAGNFVGGNSDFTMNGPLSVYAGAFKATSGNWYQSGDINFAGSSTFDSNLGTIVFYSGTFNVGSNSFNNINFAMGQYGSVAMSGTMTVQGTLTYSSPNCTSVSGGAIEAKGDVTFTSNFGSWCGPGSTTLRISGSGTQTLTGPFALGFPRVPALEIASTGTVNFAGDLGFENFTYTSGTVNTGTSNVGFENGTVSPGNIVFNNVTFYQMNFGVVTVAGTIVVNGTTSMSGWDNAQLNGGTLDMRGDLTYTTNVAQWAGNGGSTALKFSGTGTQTITPYTNAKFSGGNITVNKASGSVTLAGDVSFNSSGQTVSVTAGSVNLAGHNLTINTSLSLNGNTLTKSSGVLTVGGAVAGTGSLFGGTVNP